MTIITKITAHDMRFPLAQGEGADAVHSDPVYSYAVARLHTDGKHCGTGLAFTLGAGNDLVTAAIELLGAPLVGYDIEELMAKWGAVSKSLSDHSQLRWLGPHKGVFHLALASLTNAAFDLWAKSRGVPLWRLLLDLTPGCVVDLLDLSYLEEVLPHGEALSLIEAHRESRPDREPVIRSGYPGYDTSVGWFNYSDSRILSNARRAVEEGFTAMKLKVGSKDMERDLHRARLVREAVGDGVRLMVDANQQWTLPVAMEVCRKLAEIDPYWIEEPTHPDDILGHKTLAEAIAPIPLAVGEHIPNRVVFKNYMQARAAEFIQVDATRVGGVSEFITVSLLARKFCLKVVPHVGDVGQIHRHLVLFNHIALGLERIFLEYIPHLAEHFVHPAVVREGVYQTPQEPGLGTDLKSFAEEP
jgi:L-fuconate dehydratase